MNRQTLVVMPAKAGIHIHAPVSMDTGFRLYDIQSASAIQTVLTLL
jgi:hypothetical protein